MAVLSTQTAKTTFSSIFVSQKGQRRSQLEYVPKTTLEMSFVLPYRAKKNALSFRRMKLIAPGVNLTTKISALLVTIFVKL